jgi:KRAB domain-containing zinc finger protein
LQSTSKETSEILPKLRSKREGTFSCQICELKFHQRKNLLIHKRNSHLKNVKCKNEDCNLMFRFESSMELHFNRDHLNIKSESNLSFYCDQCEYKTQLKNSMKRHVTRHIEKTLKCDKCSYKTYRLEVLTLHKLSHGSRSSFPCEFCGKILTKLTTLKSHIRIHHTETSYPCEFCEFSAKSIFSLDNHWKKSHSQLQPSIPCEYKECNEKFFTKQVLKKHLRDKHLANIKCLDENCTRMFYYENLMLNHFSMVHEKEKYAVIIYL